MENLLPSQEYTLTVGLDWADKFHKICWRKSGNSKAVIEDIASDPTSIKKWIERMLEEANGGPVTANTFPRAHALKGIVALKIGF